MRTPYFADSLEAPAWRAQWFEHMRVERTVR